MDKKVKDEVKKPEVMFSKNQILGSRKFSHRRDILAVILDDRKSYSFKDVSQILDRFMKGGHR